MNLWEKKDARVRFRIALAGDYLPSAGLRATADCDWKCRAAKLAAYFENIDLAIANLECPIDVEGCAARPKIGLGENFSAPLESLEYLSALRVKLVGIANNHIYDYGPEGLRRTQEAIKCRGFTAIGSGRTLGESPEVFTVETPSAGRIGFWAAARNLPELATQRHAGVEPATAGRAGAAIAELLHRGTNLNIAFLHAGIEHTNRPDPDDVEFMDELIARGFDVVAASHSHRIGGYRAAIEKGGRPAFCFYGLGSLSSGIKYSELEQEGLILVIGLDESGEVAQVEVQPILLSPEGWGMIPEWADAKAILDRFMMLSLEIVEGSYGQRFYEDTGKDLVRRQLRNLRAAYERGGLSGLAQILSRIRMRHINRVLHKAF
ncbi:MAG TPA: CapA family protein [Candidatus Acidoferrum sp.]|nr:CapA family protein [Candidatus Acidoferrum sp.]